MRIVLAGNERIGHECLKILLQEKLEVVGVITDKADKKAKLENRRIKFLAKEAGIRLYEPENINHPDFVEELRRLDPHILFNVAFLQLYKAPVLAVPGMGCINFHPGPLPKYGGSNGWVWAIINGEGEYGVAFHYMKEKIDTGDIIGLEMFPIEKDETGLSLLMKCYDRGVSLFRKTLRNILEGSVIPVPQDMSNRSYYYNKVPYEGLLDPSWSSTKITDFVRGMDFSPFPNPLSPAMVSFMAGRLIVKKAKDLGNNNWQKKPGEVIETNQEGVVMQTGEGAVLLSLSDRSLPQEDTAGICAAWGIGKGSILGC